MERRYKAVLALGVVGIVIFVIGMVTELYLLGIAAMLFTTCVLGYYLLGEANVPGSGSAGSHREPPDSHTSRSMRKPVPADPDAR